MGAENVFCKRKRTVTLSPQMLPEAVVDADKLQQKVITLVLQRQHITDMHTIKKPK